MRFLKSGVVLAHLCFSWTVSASIPFMIVCSKGEISKDKKKETEAFLMWKESGYDGDVSCKDTSGWQKISIKHRGNSSMKFAKKQYGFKILDEEGNKTKVALGDFPKNSNWVMRSPYIDRSLIRDGLAYNLGRDLGKQRGDDYAAPRTEFIEFAINGDYKGIFVLTEKIQHGRHHVPIQKADASDLDHLTYIAEISSQKYDFKSKRGTMIRFNDPNEKKLKKLAEKDPYAAQELRKRIKNEINHFERVLLSDDFADPERGYRALVDFDSFVDYFIIQELSKNIDGFRRSEFFYKAKDGKFHMGPYWDFDIAFGNLSFYGMAKTKGWSHTKHWSYLRNAFWFNRLLKDPYFAQGVHRRYAELREEGNLLSWANLETRIDSMQTRLGDAPERDRLRWDGTHKFTQRHIMNTKKRSEDLQGNVDILKQWVQERLKWLDSQMGLNGEY